MTNILSLTNMNEHELIQRARDNNDSRAFSNLVVQHQGSLRVFLFRLCKDYNAADDLAQETFLQAHRKLQSFRGDCKFSTWLFSIGYRSYLQELRKTKREKAKRESFSSESSISPGSYESISESHLDLERAMLQLPVGERTAITLCYSFGCSHSEASSVLKIPVGTVKTNIARGKNTLQKLLGAKK